MSVIFFPFTINLSATIDMFFMFNNRTYLKPYKDVVATTIDQTVSFKEISTYKVIDKDLQSALKPLNAMLFIYFSTKYSIRNDIVTSNYTVHKILCAIWILVTFGLCVYRFIEILYYPLSHLGLFYSFINTIDLVIVVCAIIRCCSLFKKNNDDLLMLYKIQYVFQVLQISRDQIRNLIFCYWISCIVFNIFVFSTFIGIFYIFQSFETVNTAYVCFVFDVSTIYTFLILKLLRKILRIWIEKVVQSKSIDDGKKGYWNTIFDVYLKIQEIFMIINKISQYIVSLHIPCVIY